MTWEDAGAMAWIVLSIVGSVGVYFVLVGLIAYLLGLARDDRPNDDHWDHVHLADPEDQFRPRSPWNRW